MTSPSGSSGQENNRVARVLIGFTRLESAEQSAFIDALNNYNRGNIQTKSALAESYRMQIDAGPVGSICPCCGR